MRSRVPSKHRLPIKLLVDAGLLRAGLWRYHKRRGFLSHADALPVPLSFMELIAPGQAPSRRGLPGLLVSKRSEAIEDLSADWLLLRNRAVLAVDSQSRKVIRIDSAPYVSTDYEMHRSRFSLHVPSAAFGVLPGRIGIVESVIEGQTFRAIEPECRVEALDQLMTSLENLIAQEGIPEAGRILELVCSTSPIRAVREQSDAIVDAMGHLPLVPAHADISKENIVLANDMPVLVDFGNMRLGLPTEDAISLAGLMGGDVVANRMHCLERVATATNVPFNVGKEFGRLAVLAGKALTLWAKPILPHHLQKKYAKWDREHS